MRSKGADERPLALGPTGRPLHPVGALFEAAFRRLGQRFASYLLYTIACGLPAALVYRFVDHGDHQQLLALEGLDGDGIAASIRRRFGDTPPLGRAVEPAQLVVAQH